MTPRPTRLALGALCLTALTAAPRPQASEQEDRVRLLVVVVVEQLIPEQLQRLAPELRGGLGRFLREGRVHWRAFHGHGVTQTAPGYATLATGVHPSRHGLVADTWMAAEERVTVDCVQDDEVQLVTNAGIVAHANKGTRSPGNLLEPTLGDHLRALFPGSRSAAIGMREHASIPAGGRAPELCVWWDRRGYGFVSSTWYGEELAPWVQTWNQYWPTVFTKGGYTWEADLPGNAAALGTAPDEREGEVPFHGGRTLPKKPREPALPLNAGDRLALSQWIRPTPLADRFVLELARETVDGLELGQDGEPDVLFVGLDAADTIGNLAGPYSCEVTSVLLQADRELGAFFDHLDERVGEGCWLAALAADHGVLELPEALVACGVDAQRTHLGPVAQRLNEVRRTWAEELDGDFYVNHSAAGLRFSREKLAQSELTGPGLRARAREAFLQLENLARVFSAEELQAADPSDPLATLFARSFHPERSPDVSFVWKPWHVEKMLGTASGSPWPYDRHVPLAFLGPGVEPGARHTPCATVDLLPTLLHLAGLPVPDGLDGRVIE